MRVPLDTLLAALLWEEDLAPPDAARIWENTNITSRVAQHFSSRLKGNWTRNPGKPIGEWFHEVVVVRNSVLHGGRTPMRSEVDIAGEATNRLYAFLAERLVSNWRRYPKTMSVFVGPKPSRSTPRRIAGRKWRRSCSPTTSSRRTSIDGATTG